MARFWEKCSGFRYIGPLMTLVTWILTLSKNDRSNFSMFFDELSIVFLATCPKSRVRRRGGGESHTPFHLVVENLEAHKKVTRCSVDVSPKFKVLGSNFYS